MDSNHRCLPLWVRRLQRRLVASGALAHDTRSWRKWSASTASTRVQFAALGILRSAQIAAAMMNLVGHGRAVPDRPPRFFSGFALVALVAEYLAFSQFGITPRL